MKFSIVIPIYNVEKYLYECLESVINQTFTDFEAICINDGSTDNSLQIIQKFKNSKIQDLIIIDKQNGGLSDARNAGIKAAQGDYIFLLDSDDYIASNTLEILAKNIDNQDFIAFNGHRFFENGFKENADSGISENRLTGWAYYNKYALVPRKFHFVCTVLRLYKREFLLKNNLFFYKGIYHEDNLFTSICCYYAEDVKVIPDILYFYRIREGSITQNVNLAATTKRLKDIMFIINELTVFFKNKNIDKIIVERQNAMWILNGLNILCINNLYNEIEQTFQLLTPDFKKTITDFDMKFLFLLIEKKRFSLFKKLYYIDFIIVRNYWRKIKKRIK
jgi:glycosyltransferase involved in cell wall biosynthesis